MSNSDPTLVTWHEHSVQRPRGCVVWFTGLSGSGKSTIANCLDALLHQNGHASFVLDGDNIRHGLNASRELLAADYDSDFAERFGLGFAEQDRRENIRRIGSVAELFCQAGVIAISAFVSPYRRDRDAVRHYVNRQEVNRQTSINNDHGDGAEETESPGDFVEVFVDTPIEICEQRDPKGLYQKARAGELKGFTGIDAPYEAPINPEVVLAGGSQSPAELAQQVCEHLQSIGKLSTGK